MSRIADRYVIAIDDHHRLISYAYAGERWTIIQQRREVASTGRYVWSYLKRWTEEVQA
jgi:hypothetical protein